MPIRVGIGYDVHRLTKNRKLVLGGVHIPYRLGLLGHSDGDCLVHAIIDAILGACGLGDIGEMFPDSDKHYEDISSILLLERVREATSRMGTRIHNIDATIVAEQPKILPYKNKMREIIATALKIDPSTVNIKAKTTEGLGFEGEMKGIAAYAVALVEVP